MVNNKSPKDCARRIRFIGLIRDRFFFLMKVNFVFFFPLFSSSSFSSSSSEEEEDEEEDGGVFGEREVTAKSMLTTTTPEHKAGDNLSEDREERKFFRK